jgi:PIN domain-containing protein
VRTNYILIDFENVQPQSLDRLDHDYFKVLVFVGANQGKLAYDVAASLQALGDRAEYIKISGVGANALDFHIAYYIGQRAAHEPSAYFHIISKDTGFDPLIEHLRSKKIYAGRAEAIADIPAVKALNSKSPQERVAFTVARLRKLKAAKPRTVKTLKSAVSRFFLNQLPEDDVGAIVQTLVKGGYLQITETKVSYALPN